MKILETIKKPVIVSKVMVVLDNKDKWMRVEFDNGRIQWDPTSYDGESEDGTGELEKQYQALVYKPKVLFTTQDGVEITEYGTKMYSVLVDTKNGYPAQCITIVTASQFTHGTILRPTSKWKHFSTDELRQEYKIEHVQCLSIADVRHENYDNMTSPETKSIHELEQIVQQRMR